MGPTRSSSLPWQRMRLELIKWIEMMVRRMRSRRTLVRPMTSRMVYATGSVNLAP